MAQHLEEVIVILILTINLQLLTLLMFENMSFSLLLTSRIVTQILLEDLANK